MKNRLLELIESYIEKNDLERIAYFKILMNEERLNHLMLAGKLYDF